MMAAICAKGTTIIRNAAREPEITELQDFLVKMGAKLHGAGSSTIVIEGGGMLKGVRHRLLPDRIVAGTYMVAAAITAGDITVENVRPDHLSSVYAKLKECGCRLTIGENTTRVVGPKRPNEMRLIETLPHPGFPTDMQSQFMALLATVKGPSVVIETVFENRYMHIGELNRMGANIKIEGRSAVIAGGQQLVGAKVIATDLRAGAALVLAGLMAEGTTEIAEIYHIERGYSNFIEKMTTLGAKIRRAED
jgi:UDP-N-acetylglucosamine 1-carboxyvinyltransferase